MTTHETIKGEIKSAMRAKDTIKLDTLRGLDALFTNELLQSQSQDQFIADDKALALIKRSAKQRKDSIEQFTKGGRQDLVDKEKAELKILESYLPEMMSVEEIRKIVMSKIETLRSLGKFDPKSSGKITGMIMKELSGRANGNDVKIVVEELANQ